MERSGTMTAHDKTQDKNKTKVEINITVDAALLTQLDDLETITTSTSLMKLAAMLHYLAECEFALSRNNDSDDANTYNGRGYLLQMLGQGLGDFSENIDNLSQLFTELERQMAN